MLTDQLHENAPGNRDDDQQNSLPGNENALTGEGLNDKEPQQPDKAVNKGNEPVTNAGSYRDTSRVGSRANEASDPNDTNTGGIISGGAKGASQS